MTKDRHIHKLKRLKFKSGNAVFFCALPDCSFKINTSLALGKRSICWRCGNDFIMSEYSLRLAKPHCDACHRPKESNNPPAVGTMDERLVTGEGQLPSLSLAERLNQTIQNAKQQTEQEDEI